MKCFDFTLDSGFVTFYNLIFLFISSTSVCFVWPKYHRVKQRKQEPDQAVQYRAFT